jgi:hypothetical protein
LITAEKNHYNRGVNKAGMQISAKTGLVLKISLVLILLLGTVVYKLNDYFQNDKWYSMQSQLRNRVVLVKTTVSSQLSQLRNTVSSYENELNDNNINWVQLDPFFAIARLENNNGHLHVNQMLVRSNTPAERWNAAYLEKALTINKPKESSPIIVQLFLDGAGEKYIVIRFKTSGNQELSIVSGANYFQKYFDINRGENSTSLLVTTEDLLAAHSEGDYIATSTHETQLSSKKYLYEKEEIVGTNLIAMNYVLKKKITAAFAVPWSIVGVVAGVGCLLIAVLFYALDPMEKKVERYKKQERAQIYKDTVGDFVAQVPVLANPTGAPTLQNKIDDLKAKIEKSQIEEARQSFEVKPREGSVRVEEPVMAPAVEVKSEVSVKPEIELEPQAVLVTETPEPKREDEVEPFNFDEMFSEEKIEATADRSSKDQFLSLDDENIDLQDIEKALALDDFDNDEISVKASSDRLEKNLTPQKISVGATTTIDRPQFALEKRGFKVDQLKINIRRPEKL